MRVETLSDDGSARWNSWVGPRTRSIGEMWAWRSVVGEAYGIRAHMLLAVDEEGQTRGALALYEVRHPLLGHYLTTAPFCSDGGLLYDCPEACDALLADARRLGDSRRVSHVVVRTRDEDLRGFMAERRYQTALIDLQGGAAGLWSRLPGKTRNQVRRGQKEGFTVTSGPDQIEPFHRVFHEHMRELGSPAHALRYYELVARHLGDQAQFIVVREGNVVVAGALLLTINDTASNLHTVARREYNRRCPNYLLYWHMLEVSAKAGCTRFDIGRSVESSSTLAFKENWNPEVAPLSYNYYLRTLKEAPFVDPRNPRYRLSIELWRRLPLRITRALGPCLIRGLV